MIKRFLNLLLGIAILVGFGWGIYLFLANLLPIITSLNPTLSAGIIAASATVFVSIGSVLVSKHLEQKALILKEHREKKAPVYEEFIGFLFKTLLAEKVGQPKPTEEEMVKFFVEYMQKMIVWGSDDVVRAYSEFRSQAGDPIKLLFSLEDLLFKIRTDLGHKNQNLKTGTILSLFVNDLEQGIQNFTLAQSELTSSTSEGENPNNSEEKK